ncbi:hypothetical protein STENM223S_06725 [Streptomyces tendae]
MAPRLPRPRRFDVYAASAGLLGGLLLWGIGLGVRPAERARVLFDGRWPLLVPLVVMAGCELLRRASPRTGLLVGTAALIGDTLTQGSLVTGSWEAGAAQPGASGGAGAGVGDLVSPLNHRLNPASAHWSRPIDLWSRPFYSRGTAGMRLSHALDNNAI